MNGKDLKQLIKTPKALLILLFSQRLFLEVITRSIAKGTPKIKENSVEKNSIKYRYILKRQFIIGAFYSYIGTN